MNIKNRILFNLYQMVKTRYNYEMALNGYGLYIEGFSGGITVYAKGAALYRQTLYGDNKLQFCSYFDTWTQKEGVTCTENLESESVSDGDKAAQEICEFIVLFSQPEFNTFTITGREFKKAVEAVDTVNKHETHNIVISAHGGFIDIASLPNSKEYAVWQLEGKTGASGAVMVSKKHLGNIKGKMLNLACIEHNGKLGLHIKGDIDAVLPTIDINHSWFSNALEYKYREPQAVHEAKPVKQKRIPTKRPPKRENGALIGWTYNNLGTKQTKVCNW